MKKEKREKTEKRVKVGKYKTVFKGIIFEVQQAKATCPSGQVRTFEKIIRPPSVTILAIDSKGRLLLNKEYRLKFNRYMWCLPGGRVDEGEKPEEAAQRELQEETGYRAKSLKLFHLSDRGGQSMDWKIYAFLGKDLVKDPLENTEGEDIKKVMPAPLEKAMKVFLETEALS